MKRVVRLALLLVAGIGLVAAGWWAGSVAIEPPEDPLGDPKPITYQVVEGSVGRSLRFVAVAEWPLIDAARTGSGGTVTSVEVTPGDTVDVGDRVYSVDLRPAVIGVGATPSFRDLGLRASGPDVAQLQTLLAELGFYDGEVDAEYGASTRNAVRAWQATMGIDDDGIVQRGDVVWLPELPIRVVPTDALQLGAPLSAGEVVLQRVVGEPEFTIPLALEQRAMVPLSAVVRLAHSDGVWEGRIAEAREVEEQGLLELVLKGGSDGPLCGPDCSQVPLVGRTDYTVEIIVVQEVTGPIVPLAAIRIEPDGSTVVIDSLGTAIEVAILGASDGLGVVDGVRVGDVLLLPVIEEQQ